MAAWRYLRDESLAVPLLALLLVIIALVPPTGDFPLNDDWIYAQTVQEVLDTGVYRGHPYADPLFLVHAYWGALVTSIFGFSFVVLRCSTLLLLWVAGWMAARCAREVETKREVALFIGALIIANPIALNLGYTFMTDIPFLALAHASLYVFLRAIRSGSVVAIAIGSGLAVAAYFIRQFGLLLPVAFFAYEVFRLFKGRVQIDFRRLLALGVPWIAALIIVRLLSESARGISPEFDTGQLGSSIVEQGLTVLQHMLRSLTYVVLFLIPILALLVRKPVQVNAKRILGYLTLLLIGFWILLRGEGATLPYFGNMLYNLGVGPITLRGIVVDGQLAAPVQLGWLWWAITVPCGIGAIFLLSSGCIDAARDGLISQHAKENKNSPRLFLILLTAAYILVLIIPGVAVIYDRYLLMPLLPVALLLAPSVTFSRGRVSVAAGCAAMMFVFSVVALQDYMAWQSARWQAWTILEQDHAATPETIDGGYEFHGWYTSDDFVTESTTPDTRRYGPKGGWVIDDRYAISFVERDNFDVIDRVPYYTWLGFEERDILILRRVREDEF